MASIIGEGEEPGETEANPLGVYEGERNERGERHGKGKALLPNGDIYVGGYCKGLRHGKGLYVLKNGARYDGEWRQGLKYGQGTFWYPDGSRYEASSSFANEAQELNCHRLHSKRKGDWKRDTKYGFGAYRYANKDVYEGGWKKNFRHGLGTYIYAATGAKFMGTWTKDRMQGPGQLVHSRHRFYGSWQLNLPYGRGCFVFESSCMQHGHYVHERDPNHEEIEGDVDREDDGREANQGEVAVGDGNKAGETQPPLTEEAISIQRGTLAIWRARYVSTYNPDLLPSEAVPIKEETSIESLPDKCEEDDVWDENEEYLKYPEAEYRGEYDDFYGIGRRHVTSDYGG